MRLRAVLALAEPGRAMRTALHGEAAVAAVLAGMGDAGGPEVAVFVGADGETVEVCPADGDGRPACDWPIAVILPPGGGAAGGG